MQQVGKGTDFPLRLIDRRIDIIDEFLCTNVIRSSRASTALHSSWRQSNAGKSNHVDRMQSAAAPPPEAITVGDRVLLQPVFLAILSTASTVIRSPIARWLPTSLTIFPLSESRTGFIVVSNSRRRPPRVRRCRQQTDLPSARQHRRKRKWTSRPLRSCSHELLFRGLRLKFRASVRRPDSCSRRKTVRHPKSAFRRDIPEHVSSGACGTPVGYSSHSCT